MRKKINFIMALLFMSFFCTITMVLADEPNKKSQQNWSQNSAYLVPTGRMEVGLFQSMRYGLLENMELSSHPLVFVLMPNLSLKWSHKSFGGFTFSTRHSIYYPSPLLRNLAREGIGGIISPEFEIPDMVSLYNEALLSKIITKHHLLTGKLGIAFAKKFSELDERTTIDLPIVFPRLAVFYYDYSFRFGFDVQGKLFKRWEYLMDADLFYIPKSDENIAFEHKGLVVWTKSPRFQLCFGYKLSYCEYPFGTQWHLLLPLFDLQWAWQLK